MEKLLALLKGNKTYLISAIMITLAVLEALNVFTMPEYGWAILAGLGLTTLRAGVSAIRDELKKTG